MAETVAKPTQCRLIVDVQSEPAMGEEWAQEQETGNDRQELEHSNLIAAFLQERAHRIWEAMAPNQRGRRRTIKQNRCHEPAATGIGIHDPMRDGGARVVEKPWGRVPDERKQEGKGPPKPPA